MGALIQMSQKDILELRNVGILSREEITNAIESIVQNGKVVYHEQNEVLDTGIEAASEINRISKVLPEIESIRLDDIPFSVRTRNALKRSNDELVQMSEKDIMSLHNVGTQTRDEIVAVITAVIKKGKAYLDNLVTYGNQDLEDNLTGMADGKGFDFSAIDVLTENTTEIISYHHYPLIHFRFSLRNGI